MDTMKAIRVQAYGGPEQLRFEDAPAPLAVDGQVLVSVRATSVNPFDLKLASGIFREKIPLTLPYIPGGEFSGVIDDVAPDVVGFKKGDAVFGNCPSGAYAERLAVSADTVANKPDKLTFTDAACIPLAGQTAWQALFDQGELRRGETVLIHAAAGGVGTYAVQLAHWAGARVLTTASASNREYLTELGADEVIDYKATPFESVAKDVDLVLDLLGGQTQAKSFGVLKKGGRLVSTVQPPPQPEAQKHGVRATFFSMKPSSAGLIRLAELIESADLKVVVSQVLPLRDAPRAWTESKSGHVRGKIVLEV
jgi:NADPH:quinone reductase-like Zn-dependent oxidoreductase